MSKDLYQKALANFAGYIDDPATAFGIHHYELYHAVENGDCKTFFKYASKATEHDLEWCHDVVSHVKILRYMYEERQVQGLGAAYITAVKKDNKPIMEFYEARMGALCTRQLADQWLHINPWSKCFFRTRCKNRKRDRQRQVQRRLYDRLKLLERFVS